MSVAAKRSGVGRRAMDGTSPLSGVPASQDMNAGPPGQDDGSPAHHLGESGAGWPGSRSGGSARSPGQVTSASLSVGMVIELGQMVRGPRPAQSAAPDLQSAQEGRLAI